MTICIAAIAKEDDKEYIIFSTDHMITTAMGQFEHSIVKYKQLNKNTVAMLAGDSLLFDDLTRLDNSALPFGKIKLDVFKNFKNKRREIIENQIFEVFGINQTFFIDSLQKPIPNPFVHSILERVAEFELETAILLIGFDNGHAQISEVNEGGFADFRMINFHAIGSGNTQAANTLLFQKHSKKDKLLPTVYNVYKAKRNAEVLEGVGKETELLVLSETGVTPLKNEHIKILEEIYQDELKYGKNHKNLNSIKLF
jgi:hypothetical protein